MINGIGLGIVEIALYLYISSNIMNKWPILKDIPIISYFWYMMTILTFIWETSYIINYLDVVNMSKSLLIKNQHVWTKHCSISDILPWNLAPIFYSEYGAYADREYMAITDQWSKIVEGSHLLFCGIFALIAIVSKIKNKENMFVITSTISMGTQLMNSILYMCNYFLQSKTQNSVNFDNSSFPMGEALSNRPFMWVNIFWTVMPSYVLTKSLIKAYNRDTKVLHTIQ